MLWLILFMHDHRDPSVRVVEGSEEEAEALRDMVRVIYDDPRARVVRFHPSHRDTEAIEEAYKEVS